MILHTLETRYFGKDQVTTEFDVYKSLKRSPLQTDVNYLAVPWAVLINQKRLAGIAAPRLNHGFTVCQHIQYRLILPLLEELGVDTLFSPHVDHDEDRIRILPLPHQAVHGICPARQKDLLYSFIGFDSTRRSRSGVRRQIFEMAHPQDSVVIERKQWHWASGRMALWNQFRQKQEYQKILSRSRFSLCPRGTGVSTIRFWESLQAGAIPVLFADEMRLPGQFAWDSCVIRVPECEARFFPDYLKPIHGDLEETMRQQCYLAYHAYCGTNIARSIREAYGETL